MIRGTTDEKRLTQTRPRRASFKANLDMREHVIQRLQAPAGLKTALALLKKTTLLVEAAAACSGVAKVTMAHDSLPSRWRKTTLVGRTPKTLSSSCTCCSSSSAGMLPNQSCLASGSAIPTNRRGARQLCLGKPRGKDVGVNGHGGRRLCKLSVLLTVTYTRCSIEMVLESDAVELCAYSRC